MVEIEVNRSGKCNGDYSLWISFKYDNTLVDIMRSQLIRYWHPENHKWEIPIKCYDSLLTDLKDYEVHLIDEAKILETLNNTTANIIPSNYEFKVNPFKHQLEGIEYGLKYDKFLLCDEQRIRKNNAGY